MTDSRAHALFLAATLVALIGAVFDWRKGHIPNWLTYAALVLGPMAHAGIALGAKESMDVALEEGAFSVGGALTCAIVPFLLYRQGALGGGDLKILAALGALLQPSLGLEAQLYAFLSAAILAPARLAYEGKLFSTLKNAFLIGGNLFLPKSKQRSIEESALSWFRLGPPIFLGVALTTYLHW